VTDVPAKQRRPRDAKGRFNPGHTGNARGRPPLPVDHVRLSAMTRDAVLAAANLPITVQGPGGRLETMTAFEARVLELASGRPRSRIQCRGFINMVLIAAGSRLPEPPPPVNPSPEEVEHIIVHGSKRAFEAMLAAQAKWYAFELARTADAKVNGKMRTIYGKRSL
jgi:hypothetical protein